MLQDSETCLRNSASLASLIASQIASHPAESGRGLVECKRQDALDSLLHCTGQGNLIYQCLPDGTTTVWANISVTGACSSDNAGVGVTMALSRCGSVIIVGSLPINPATSEVPPPPWQVMAYALSQFWHQANYLQ